MHTFFFSSQLRCVCVCDILHATMELSVIKSRGKYGATSFLATALICAKKGPENHTLNDQAIIYIFLVRIANEWIGRGCGDWGHWAISQSSFFFLFCRISHLTPFTQLPVWGSLHPLSFISIFRHFLESHIRAHFEQLHFSFFPACSFLMGKVL